MQTTPHMTVVVCLPSPPLSSACHIADCSLANALIPVPFPSMKFLLLPYSCSIVRPSFHTPSLPSLSPHPFSPWMLAWISAETLDFVMLCTIKDTDLCHFKLLWFSWESSDLALFVWSKGSNERRLSSSAKFSLNDSPIKKCICAVSELTSC